MVAAFVIIMASPQARAWQIGDVYTGGDWTINNPTSVGDETVTVSGNLTINSQLTMYAAKILMNSTTDGIYTVNVASGGSLRIWGLSTLSAADGTYHYKFTVYGTLDVNVSTVSEMWGDPNSWVGGIQVYSSSTTIRNSSHIMLGETGGVYVKNQAITITGSNIHDNGGSGNANYSYGIYISSSGGTTSTIDGDLIYDNNYISGGYYYGCGIYAVGLTPTDRIINSRIWNNGGSTGGYNYGTQLNLSGSSPLMVNLYLGNGTYGIYATNSSPPQLLSVTINSYTYQNETISASYGVYAYNSTLSFNGCDFTHTNITGRVYGVYAWGPTENSTSRLDFLTCNFTYTLPGAFDKYNIYIGNGYTPINLTTCRFTDTCGTYIYCVYATSYSPINILTSTFTVSNSNYSTYGIYGSSFCPINITNTIITMTNIGQNMSSAPAYMIYAFNNSPVSVVSSIFTMTIGGGYGSTYPSYYMIYASSLSPVSVAKSTMNMVSTTIVGNYSWYTNHYLIYTSLYCGANVSDSWLNFTSTNFSNISTTYMIYSISYSPVVVTNSNLRTTVTSLQTGNYIYLYQIYADTYSPIRLWNSNLTITPASSAPYTYIRMLLPAATAMFL